MLRVQKVYIWRQRLWYQRLVWVKLRMVTCSSIKFLWCAIVLERKFLWDFLISALGLGRLKFWDWFWRPRHTERRGKDTIQRVVNAAREQKAHLDRVTTKRFSIKSAVIIRSCTVLVSAWRQKWNVRVGFRFAHRLCAEHDEGLLPSEHRKKDTRQFFSSHFSQNGRVWKIYAGLRCCVLCCWDSVFTNLLSMYSMRSVPAVQRYRTVEHSRTNVKKCLNAEQKWQRKWARSKLVTSTKNFKEEWLICRPACFVWLSRACVLDVKRQCVLQQKSYSAEWMVDWSDIFRRRKALKQESMHATHGMTHITFNSFDYERWKIWKWFLDSQRCFLAFLCFPASAIDRR